MAGIDSKSFDQPDETRTPDKTRIDVVRLGDTEVGRFTFSARLAVVGVHQAGRRGRVLPGRPRRHGRLRPVGRHPRRRLEVTLSPGQAYRIAPGHDAWVEGDEDFVGYEFKGAAGCAKP